MVDKNGDSSSDDLSSSEEGDEKIDLQDIMNQTDSSADDKDESDNDE